MTSSALPILALSLALAGCGTTGLPEPGPEDCQVRAGAALTEGTASFTGVGGISADARGGAYTRIGKCDTDRDHVFTKSQSSVACHGTEAWCLKALEQAPVTIPRADYDRLVESLRDNEQSP